MLKPPRCTKRALTHATKANESVPRTNVCGMQSRSALIKQENCFLDSGDSAWSLPQTSLSLNKYVVSERFSLKFASSRVRHNLETISLTSLALRVAITSSFEDSSKNPALALRKRSGEKKISRDIALRQHTKLPVLVGFPFSWASLLASLGIRVAKIRLVTANSTAEKVGRYLGEGEGEGGLAAAGAGRRAWRGAV